MVFGNSVPQNPSPLALLPRAFNFPQTPSPRRRGRASRAPRRAAFPCLSAGYYYARRRSADPVPVQAERGIGLVASFPPSHVGGKQPQRSDGFFFFPPSSKRWCCSPIEPELSFVSVRPVAPFWSCVLRAVLVFVWLLLFLLLLLTAQDGLVAALGSLAT